MGKIVIKCVNKRAELHKTVVQPDQNLPSSKKKLVQTDKNLPYSQRVSVVVHYDWHCSLVSYQSLTSRRLPIYPAIGCFFPLWNDYK